MSMYHFTDAEAVEHDVNTVPESGDFERVEIDGQWYVPERTCQKMPTDDERREVALRLRGARYGWRSWQRALYDALGIDLETAGFDMLDRLADLIEPSCDRDALEVDQ